MRSSPSLVAPFFRSDAQGAILGRVLLGSGEESLSDVATGTGVPLTTVQREVKRLEDAGVVLTRKLGNTRLVQANAQYALLAPLREIVAATYGPQHVIADRFSALDGPTLVAIFGSWAARMSGEPGPMPRDIDVLIVGDVDQMDADLIAASASREVGLEVNPVVISAETWRAGADGFTTELKRRPMIVLADRT